MLDRDHRLTRRDDFTRALREGRRVGGRRLVLHLGSAEESAPRVGLVVGKAVGGAVTRNQVKRRLRHVLRPRLAGLPPGALLVVRALPPAAQADSSQLAGDLDSGLRRLLAPERTGR